MLLVLRPEDKKVISVSRKKIHCHELCYAKFDPTTQSRPVIHFTDFTMNENEVTAAIEEAEKKDKEQMAAYKEDESLPKHVKSIKSQYDYKRNRDLNMAQPTPRPHPAMLEDLPHLDHQGENPIISNEKLRRDDLMEEISRWKRSISDGSS